MESFLSLKTSLYTKEVDCGCIFTLYVWSLQLHSTFLLLQLHYICCHCNITMENFCHWNFTVEKCFSLKLHCKFARKISLQLDLPVGCTKTVSNNSFLAIAMPASVLCWALFGPRASSKKAFFIHRRSHHKRFFNHPWPRHPFAHQLAQNPSTWGCHCPCSQAPLWNQTPCPAKRRPRRPKKLSADNFFVLWNCWVMSTNSGFVHFVLSTFYSFKMNKVPYLSIVFIWLILAGDFPYQNRINCKMLETRVLFILLILLISGLTAKWTALGFCTFCSFLNPGFVLLLIYKLRVL